MKDVHTREVELTLTLKVTVACGFDGTSWQVADIEDVEYDSESISFNGFVEDFFLNNEAICSELASLFAQQEG